MTPASPVDPAAPTLGRLMTAEIDEQPAVLARLLDEGLAPIRQVAEQIRRAEPRFVMLAARGTSDHAALYAKYLIEITLGLPVALASPSTVTVYDAQPHLKDVLWIAVSQSGGSPDLIGSTDAARRAGAHTLALTNAPDSALAATAQWHVDVRAGVEKAVAATKSYTAELLALWLLVDAWRGGDATVAKDLPEQAARTLELADVAAVAARYRFVDKIVTTGRGYAYPTAREAALKLMETSYVSAHAFSGADLMHGPLAMIDVDRPVIAVVSAGPGGEALRPVLERLHERDADVCIVGDPGFALGEDTVIRLPDGVDESIAPILQIMPLQRLACAIAVARHHDPDEPRGLLKVTLTR
ncbi:SIS domain-containing protein [Segeticoccus rhizosphaerae]|uniref:SIS domain-containing protein n=1 Tax=Segeticoccus rhizosphaerae TaxID=1104777 RepID=UPI001EE451C0|nr:SIS domain-containing protein [Ornithinicoccus soli]